MGVDPTNEIAFTEGLSSSASTETLSPCRTLKMPSGRPAAFQSSASQIDEDGSFSLGLSTTALPAAIATGKNHIGTMAGKLKGEITPTTPSGWRSEDTSTLVEAFSLMLPLSRCERPQANSTISWPRDTSPSASSSTLPCSDVMISASSPLRALSNSRKANRICVRRASEMSRQGGHALAAAAITASASSREARATLLVTCPVAGSKTSAVRPLVPALRAPAAQCPTTGRSCCDEGASASCVAVMFDASSRKLVGRLGNRGDVRTLRQFELVVRGAGFLGGVDRGDLRHRHIPPAVPGRRLLVQVGVHVHHDRRLRRLGLGQRVLQFLECLRRVDGDAETGRI